MSRTQKIGIVVLCLALAGVGLFFGARHYLEKKAREQVAEAASQLRPFASLAYKDLSVDLIGRRLVLSGVTVAPTLSGEPVAADRVEILDFPPLSRDAGRSVNVKIKGLVLDFGQSLFRTIRAGARELGYETLTADLSLNATYDPEARRLDIHTVEADAPDAARLLLEFHIDSLDLNNMGRGLAGVYVARQAFSRARIAGGRILYEDRSLMDRMDRVAAGNLGKSLEEIRQDKAAYFAARMNQMPEGPEKEYLRTYREFLLDPDRMEILIAPEIPVPVSRLQNLRDPLDIVEILSVKAAS